LGTISEEAEGADLSYEFLPRPTRKLASLRGKSSMSPPVRNKTRALCIVSQRTLCATHTKQTLNNVLRTLRLAVCFKAQRKALQDRLVRDKDVKLLVGSVSPELDLNQYPKLK
jgi:hypothetical protein